MRLPFPTLAIALAGGLAAAACAAPEPERTATDSARAADTAGGIIGHDSVLGPGETTGVRELPPGTLQRRRADSARAADTTARRP